MTYMFPLPSHQRFFLECEQVEAAAAAAASHNIDFLVSTHASVVWREGT
jgi:hypothetical protein